MQEKGIGGICGEIIAYAPKRVNVNGTLKRVNYFEKMIAYSQYVEYKISHYLDKMYETLFGFVSVLPGAFSTFRFEALKGQPLNEFFKHMSRNFEASCFDMNKNLAEDRIFCLEILTKKGPQPYRLSYFPNCRALTDPPLTIEGLLKQRRRWQNGSYFASWHVVRNLFCRIWATDHRVWRKIVVTLLYFYMTILQIFTFVIVGTFYSTFSIFLRSVIPDDKCLSVTHSANVLENGYLMLLLLCVIISITSPIAKA